MHLWLLWTEDRRLVAVTTPVQTKYPAMVHAGFCILLYCHTVAPVAPHVLLVGLVQQLHPEAFWTAAFDSTPCKLKIQSAVPE